MSWPQRGSPVGAIGRRLPRELVLAVVATIVVIGLSAVAILWLQATSDRHQRGVQSLGAVGLQTAVLSQLEWRAVAERGVSGELAARIRKTRAGARAALTRTIGDLGRHGAVADVDRLLTTYLSLTATELSLLAEGRLEAAARLTEDRIDPTLGLLDSRIAAAQASARSEARQVALTAKMARILLVLFNLIAIVALFWRLESSKRAAREAFFDPLTGLANRMLLADRLTQALRQAERGGRRVAVLFLDLDNFKRVNDTLGHAAGDTLLKAAAGRLSAAVRASDTIGRLGGDEFAIVLQSDTDEIDVPAAAARIVGHLAAPFAIAGRQVTMTASIGCAVSDRSGSLPDELLRNADVAMYVGKRQGKHCVVMYEPSMHEALSDRLQLETDLRAALARNEITVAYQPVVEIDTGRLRSLEALARWTHPVRGVISPVLFIPLAEEAGVIQEIGRFVLQASTQQLRSWQADPAFVPPIGVNVNVSSFQFRQGRIVDDVRDALRESGIDPATLTLEITERAVADHAHNLAATLEQLAGLGVRLAIDGVATGYSSLATLSRFPIDTLKIDRSLIKEMSAGDGGLELVRSIVELGGRLGLEVIAKGIESSAQVDLLRELGCAFGQGFHYTRPLTAAAVYGYLAKQAPASVPRARPRRGGGIAPTVPAAEPIAP